MSTGANAIPRGSRGKPPVKKAGPRPARHIPWPEIFKHHISLVEGHLKMIDMVRKHTVEGSGNHRTISNLVDRAHSMLKDAKAVQREFVAPKDAWQNVPIGSSSDTMYPGYSPKDHEYGRAAQEFGKEWSEARKRGIDFNTGPDGPEYQFGQSKGSKKRRIEQLANAESTTTTAKSEDQDANTSAATEKAQDGAPLFFFDSKPTPINGVSSASGTGRANVNRDLQPEANLTLRGSQHDETPAAANEDEEPVVEYENIDREVEARLKLKADAQKNKKEKKRKRESGASTDAAPEAKKPRSKKKGKKDKTTDGDSAAAAAADTEMADLPANDKTSADESNAVAEAAHNNGDDTSARPKKAKKHKDSAEQDGTVHKKKGRKNKTKE